MFGYVRTERTGRARESSCTWLQVARWLRWPHRGGGMRQHAVSTLVSRTAYRGGVDVSCRTLQPWRILSERRVFVGIGLDRTG